MIIAEVVTVVIILVALLGGLVHCVRGRNSDNWGIKPAFIEPVQEPVRRAPKGAKRIHADDVPATWQGQQVSDAYRQHIIDTDEEIPF